MRVVWVKYIWDFLLPPADCNLSHQFFFYWYHFNDWSLFHSRLISNHIVPMQLALVSSVVSIGHKRAWDFYVKPSMMASIEIQRIDSLMIPRSLLVDSACKEAVNIEDEKEEVSATPKHRHFLFEISMLQHLHSTITTFETLYKKQRHGRPSRK